ncbi:glycosyltransferase family 2 protein [Microbaculum marinum]|uniref:Glycosyltransferase family 2 protein n=1 Tax=Microbaculum marinum TaxID=1764581 RepID=A0AAW9RU35_9HYPH
MYDLTVAVPVFNGDAELDGTLMNVRRQSAVDFSIVVYDNASTDRTPEIVARHAREDSRIRHVRHDTNIGLVSNFITAVRDTRSEFIAWHAVDDLWSDNYVPELRELLRADPSAVLAVPGQIVESTVAGRTKRRPIPFPRRRFTPRLARALHLMEKSRSAWLYGMWRRDFLLDAYERVLNDYPVVYVHDTLVVLPALLRCAVTGTEAATFTQRVGEQKMYDLPATAAGRREVFAAFTRFCREEIDRTGHSAAAKALLKAYVVKFADKRCMRLTDLARWSVAERYGLQSRGLSEYAEPRHRANE